MIDEIKNMNLHIILGDVMHQIIYAFMAFIGVKLLVWSYLTMTFVPQYTSSVTLAVSTRNASTVYGDLSNATSMAKVLEEVLDSSLLTDVVNAEMGEDVHGLKYSCTVIPNTNLLKMAVTAQDARTAFTAVTCVLDNYQNVAATVMDNAVFHVIQQPAVAFGAVNSPNASRPSTTAGLLAMIASLGAMVYFAWKRPTVKRENQIVTDLNAKLLGSLPHETINRSIKGRVKKVNKGVVMTNASTSFPFVEQVRQMRTRVEQGAEECGAKTIVFTSMLENEGKSTVMMNLAIALAQKGKRVLVVDADLRKPAVYKLLGHADRKMDGLEKLLPGEVKMKDVIRWEAPVYFWSCAGSGTLSKSAEWLGSNKMRHLHEMWRNNMDYVLFDAPPVDAATDAEALAAIVDASVLVVREDYAPIEALNEVVDNLSRAHAKFLGCVFNDSHAPETSRAGMNTGRYGRNYNYNYSKFQYKNLTKVTSEDLHMDKGEDDE